MHIKSILAGAAIALAASVGSASAAEQFTTLEGIAADALTPQEMGVVIGTAGGLIVGSPVGDVGLGIPAGQFTTFPVSTGNVTGLCDCRGAAAFD